MDRLLFIINCLVSVCVCVCVCVPVCVCRQYKEIFNADENEMLLSAVVMAS